MVLLATLNYVDGMSAADIVKYPHYHQQYLPDVVDYESGALTPEEITVLQAKGHKLKEGRRPWGNMQVVTWDFATGKVRGGIRSARRRRGPGLLRTAHGRLSAGSARRTNSGALALGELLDRRAADAAGLAGALVDEELLRKYPGIPSALT